MIQRINLIEKKPYSITYGQLLRIFALAGVFFLGLLGFQELRKWYVHAKVESLQGDIAKIRLERDVLSREAPPKIESGSDSELRQIFRDTPDWEKLLNEIGQKIPGKVQLTNLTCKLPRTLPEAPAEAAGKKPATAPAGKALLLVGKASDVTSVASFLSKLQESPFFRNMSLAGTKMEKGGYTFSIEGDVNPGGR